MRCAFKMKPRTADENAPAARHPSTVVLRRWFTTVSFACHQRDGEKVHPGTCSRRCAEHVISGLLHSPAMDGASARECPERSRVINNLQSLKKIASTSMRRTQADQQPGSSPACSLHGVQLQQRYSGGLCGRGQRTGRHAPPQHGWRREQYRNTDGRWHRVDRHPVALLVGHAVRFPRPLTLRLPQRQPEPQLQELQSVRLGSSPGRCRRASSA